jgi:hypothetical protein
MGAIPLVAVGWSSGKVQAMTRGTIFWVIMIILAILAVASYWGHSGGPYWGMGMTVVQYVLLGLLGWQVFGAAIKG